MAEKLGKQGDESGDGKLKRKRENLADKACVHCCLKHARCENKRPCKRCIEKNLDCQDAEPQKRGRPAKPQEEYDQQVQRLLPRPKVSSPSQTSHKPHQDASYSSFGSPVDVQSPTLTSPPGSGNIFNEKQLNQIFLHLAQKAGSPTITPELKGAVNKIIEHCKPLVAHCGPHLIDICPIRKQNMKQVLDETSLPMIVAQCFRWRVCNAAAQRLIGNVLPKFIFDILHPEDAIRFVMKSVECLVSLTNLERMRVRVLHPFGVYDCIINETTQKNSHGVPLFSYFTIIRIDDMLRRKELK